MKHSKKHSISKRAALAVAMGLMLALLPACQAPATDGPKIEMDSVIATYVKRSAKLNQAIPIQFKNAGVSDTAVLLCEHVYREARFFGMETREGPLSYQERGIFTDQDLYRVDAVDVVYQIACVEGRALRSDMEGFTAYEPNHFTDRIFRTYPALHSEALDWAAELGIISGNEDGYFCPEYLATREQFILYLYNYVSHFEEVETTGDLRAFKDAEEVSAECREAVRWAVGEKIFWDADNAGEASLNLNPDSQVPPSDCWRTLMCYFVYFRGM